MIPEELEKCILADKAKGYKPFFVCCTAGTTVFGAFDPIEPCADICKKYGLWLHVDAAWGGGVLLSRKHRTKMNGVERADSVTWNPHKLMGSPLQCSTVHFREDGLLMSCNQLSADYLFQQDKHYDVNYDTGDKVIQCGRHNDIFKLWLMWRSKGDKGYERHIDHLFEMTEYMLKKLKEKKDRFHLILEEPECTNVSFWYIPKRLRNVPHSPEKEKVLAFIRALKVLTRVDNCCFKSKFYRKDLIDELKIFGMSSRHHIDDFMRGRIIGKIEEGRKITDVAREFDIAHSVVSRLWKSFKTTGMCSRWHGGGGVRSTTPSEDRYIVLSAKRNRRTTAQQVANQFIAASGKQISRKTVARRLRGGGLYARRPVVCVPLTRQHRTARLQWCREHHNWTEQDWACVLFSDESRLSLSSDCRRQLIWRESGTAYRPEYIQENDRYPTCSIMMWAGIMINGRTRLHVVANGTMTGQRYIDEVLLPHDCLDSEGIQRLVWPARSPDLNPIENVWDALGRQVSGRNYPPTNKNTYIRALTDEWDKLPQQLLDNVVQSMLTAKLKGRMMNAGTLMIGYQPQGDIPNFFRSIISNAAVQEYDIDFMLDELERLGHDL
ncbi:glutamate decarboxylase [Trichonephila clavipes]|nr:glutamate decarboxylase [Trichonephila clavipes]